MKSFKSLPPPTAQDTMMNRKRRQPRGADAQGGDCSSTLERSTFQGKKNRSKPRKTKGSKSKTSSSIFLSVLSQPFAPWNDLEITIGEFCPDWSHTHRSYIVQQLVRFLELKVVTEEFAKKKLLAPTQLLAQAWQAVILDSKLYLKVIYDIQGFHERPHMVLRHPLQRRDLLLGKENSANAKRVERTQHLFQSYYGETMLTCLDDMEVDLSLTDTSTITEGLGLWNLPVPRCGSGDVTSTSKRSGGGTSSSLKHHIATSAYWLKNTCFDAVSDMLFRCEDSEDGSLAGTVLLDDWDEMSPPTNTNTTTTTNTRDETITYTEYDSLFTFDFLRTRHLLCRGDSGGTTPSGPRPPTPPTHMPPSRDGLRVFSW